MDNSIDLKSLKVIHILTTCGSVTKTAELMGVSPGTVSYYIKKTRQLTGSNLFSRTRRGMIPDGIAKTLSERYVSVMNEMPLKKEILTSYKRSITISTYSLIELALSTSFRSTEAIKSMVQFTSPDVDETSRLNRLLNKEVDIDIGSKLPPNKNIIQIDFISSDIAIIARKHHPVIKDKFTMKNWHESNHIVWSRDMSLVGHDVRHANRFNELINNRSISVVSSSSLNMVVLCSLSDDVMIFPKELASFIEANFDIQIFEVPKELKMRFDCYLHYHHSSAKDADMIDAIEKAKNAINLICTRLI
ncbi:LysR family transcriptional regulator [Serratia proteamaculans]|uniref:LysR family transcriptional regulator n=1 Tax=Serratia proteamaculans TaxID=28151 RepID=UPI0015753DED|nr:LysR family transcriptional regulator [Serratia proteamaculans]NTX77442.1 LysR family transcriptional regulator [Serratia proteamaculans]NTZ28315.1 LysR family transcriptional regulator [Serratia proteamaculans]